MTFSEYTALAARTTNSVICDTKEKQLMHYALGFLAEFAGELQPLAFRYCGPKTISKELASDIIKETGDCCWYMSQLARELDVNLDLILGGDPNKAVEYMDGLVGTHDKLFLTGCKNIGELAEYVKKVCCFNHPRNRDKEVHLFEMAFIAFIACLNVMDINLQETLQVNIDKLKARYPEGFTTEASVNRKEGVA